ncbi:hypothetical protein [Tranquillimonas alkanivorans]|uniref:Uncharacterized protein n=1 Tax=Tranquillimonas alkanivorans TaxID=441119 RepID=A0A1I5SY43_9RHOB|nr:hypothetical protein [Tranquillimonas alkanivorans]SFP75571.1 hypothetical protein SAMN04488047_11245 [Tranquillimonas alkanivorans]
MQILEDVADQLARDTLAAVAKTGDESLEQQVSEALGSSSQTLQEAFLTAIRVRKAERRALALLARAEKD